MADYLLEDDSRALRQKRAGVEGRVPTKGERILAGLGVPPEATFGDLVEGIDPIQQALAAQRFFDEAAVERLKATPACEILDGFLSIFERGDFIFTQRYNVAATFS